MNYTIYQLSSSREPLVARYIGQTSKNAQERLSGHFSSSRTGGTAPVHQWIRKEVAAGYEIISQGLVTGLTSKAADAFERDLIQAMPKHLLNVEYKYDPALLAALVEELRVSMRDNPAAWEPWTKQEQESYPTNSVEFQ